MSTYTDSQLSIAFSEIRRSIEEDRKTVGYFAKQLRKDVTALLEQLHAAGVPKEGASSQLTNEDKHKLLVHLQSSHGTGSPERKRIVLVKKSPKEGLSSDDAKAKNQGDSSYSRRRSELRVVAGLLPALEHYEVIRCNGTIAKFSQVKVDYELVRAFSSIHSRNPDSSELEELVGLSDRLNVHLAELPAGTPDQLLAALRNSSFAVAPRFSEVLLRAVFALVHYGRQGNELALTLFEAKCVDTVPASQKGLHVGSCRSALAAIASVAWRLLRLKHFLPVHAATISLA